MQVPPLPQAAPEEEQGELSVLQTKLPELPKIRAGQLLAVNHQLFPVHQRRGNSRIYNYNSNSPERLGHYRITATIIPGLLKTSSNCWPRIGTKEDLDVGRRQTQ